ncbi:hypothetical protein ACGFN1_32035 [Streptomyces sp. NPDC048685]|uniref:hypothetical protein n=1 Tax=Streptomyces sp. NPDC048685 TaxID=3365584 RepID=UPI003714BE5C
MHDQTVMRTESIAEQLCLHPQVKAKVDEGYRSLANDFPNQVQAPPRKPKDKVPLGENYAWREARRRQSSARGSAWSTASARRRNGGRSSGTSAGASPTL